MIKEMIKTLQTMRKKSEHTLNTEIYLTSMINQAKCILTDYKKAKREQNKYLYIDNKGMLHFSENQQELDTKAEDLWNQLTDILVKIQKFKRDKK